ncbi:MAG: 50S ribosomal protein L15 [Candidatus Margulisiibacteriota bacterium]
MDFLKPAKGSVFKKTRKGRGNSAGQGGECGRGHKGQKSRTGYSRRFGFEGGQIPLYRRIPKKRGINNPAREGFVALNLDVIATVFSDLNEVTVEAMVDRKILNHKQKVKVLGNGELSKAIKIHAHAASKSAQEKVAAAGGTLEIIG